MNLIDENEEKEQAESKKKTLKIILISIAVLVVLAIVIIIFSVVKNNNTLKLQVNDSSVNLQSGLVLMSDSKNVLIENDQIYLSVRKLVSTLGGEYYNDEYKNKGEDTTKCYIKMSNEYTSYIANSNKMYKTIVTKNTDDKDKNNTSNTTNTTNTNDVQQVNQNNNDEEYEYFTIDNNVKYVNDEIYASTQAIMLGFDVSISYDTKKNTIEIYSPDYMETLAKSNRSDTVPSTEYEYINKRLLKYGMSIVKNSDGNLGVGSYTNQDKLTSFVASCKYSSIKFNEATKTLEVTTSGDNKKCVLRLNTDNQTVEKNMDSQYDDIKEIDNDFKYFLIKDKEKYGIINSDGKIILYPLFEQIGIDEDLYTNIESKYIIDNKYIPVKQNGKWGLYSIEGKKLINPQFQDIGCTVAQSGDSVAVIPNIKDNIDGIVFLYNKEKSLYGIYNAENGSKIAISLGEVFKKSENNEEIYYMNYVIDKENNVVHTLNAQKDI